MEEGGMPLISVGDGSDATMPNVSSRLMPKSIQ